MDRLAAFGWHWVIRCKANGSLRCRDHQDREEELRARLARRVRRPGARWKERLEVFKDAGWRTASVVAVWEPQAEEPLVTLSDLPPRWELHAFYDDRFWTEPGFRNDRSCGWQWEDNHVDGIAHQETLLTAMAWATLVVLCLGRQEAQRQLDLQVARARKRVTRGRSPAEPQPARHSLFALDCHAARRWLYRPANKLLSWLLDELSRLSWNARFFQAQARLFLRFQTVRS